MVEPGLIDNLPPQVKGVTRCKADKKNWPLRSYRVAVLRQCLSMLKARPIRFRRLYSSRSYFHGFFRMDLGDMTATAPPDRLKARTLSLSYSFSAITYLALTQVDTGFACGASASCPQLRANQMGWPRASATR